MAEAMADDELQNLHYARAQSFVDGLNTDFYGEIRFPWPPESFERIVDGGLWGRMLAQDVGYPGEPLVPDGGEIWVAGCGTNQALITALRFPGARVVGSDLSAESLAVCARHAAQLAVPNLELRHESLNGASYADRFDYLISTGVIHHNADPRAVLARLGRALKPGGVMELMVYNRFHRVLTSAFQKAIWILRGCPEKPDLAAEIRLARAFVDSFDRPCLMSRFLKERIDEPDAAFADTLLQPVEHSYTVESLAEMAAACELTILASCADQFSASQGLLDWNLELEHPELRRLYAELPDLQRWQVTNLLLAEDSPMLWFYLQRRDSPRPRKPERQVCEEFLGTRFTRVRTEREVFLRDGTGRYSRQPVRSPFPLRVRGDLAAQVHEALDEQAPMRATLERLGVPTSFPGVNRLRVALATSSFPYLLAS
jgi:SAM-dependent methyltransferase